MSVGSILGALRASESVQVLDRINRLALPDFSWREWWSDAIEAVEVAGELASFEDVLRYAEDSQDEATRMAKGLGHLKHPGRFLCSRLLELARQRGIRVPEMPVNGREAKT